jgi:hypothetical protein
VTADGAPQAPGTAENSASTGLADHLASGTGSRRTTPEDPLWCSNDATVRRGMSPSKERTDQLPEAIRELVLDDQRLRNDICWSVFDC